jgi:hypothetical protein
MKRSTPEQIVAKLRQADANLGHLSGASARERQSIVQSQSRCRRIIPPHQMTSSSGWAIMMPTRLPIGPYIPLSLRLYHRQGILTARNPQAHHKLGLVRVPSEYHLR